jgi:hypothetical protein
LRVFTVLLRERGRPPRGLVRVVAVDLVELLEVRRDLGVALAGCLLGVVPGGRRVLHVVPVAVGVVALAVASLVVGNGDPVGDVTLGHEATVRLLEVEVLERLTLAEHHVLVVGPVEVRGPVRRVVVGGVAVPDTVRGGDLVVDRARGGVEAGLGLGPEVGEDGEDVLLALDRVGHEAVRSRLAALGRLGVARELDDPLATAHLGRGLALHELVDGLLAEGAGGVAQGVGQVVLPVGGLGLRVLGRRGRLRRSGNQTQGDGRNGHARESAQMTSLHKSSS